MNERIVALIPARAGSKRVVAKNTRLLAGHPLLAYAIATAQESAIFDAIVVSTDSPETARLAEQYGARTIIRPDAFATDTSPDIQWVNHAIAVLDADYDAFAILRPTSPFRRGEWVRAAWEAFCAAGRRVDSLRAMRPVREHPGKMWRTGVTAHPLLPFGSFDAPWHSMPTQELPAVCVQTAALEIAWTTNLPRSIAGDVVLPLVCANDAPEAIDLNEEADWDLIADLAAQHPEYLPPITTPAWLAQADARFDALEANVRAAAGGWQ